MLFLDWILYSFVLCNDDKYTRYRWTWKVQVVWISDYNQPTDIKRSRFLDLCPQNNHCIELAKVNIDRHSHDSCPQSKIEETKQSFVLFSSCLYLFSMTSYDIFILRSLDQNLMFSINCQSNSLKTLLKKRIDSDDLSHNWVKSNKSFILDVIIDCLHISSI
jgi:hypothetical protein